MILSQRLSYTVVFLDLLSFLFLILENSLLSLLRQKEKLRWRPYSNLLETKCIYFCHKAFEGFFLFVCLFYLLYSFCFLHVSPLLFPPLFESSNTCLSNSLDQILSVKITAVVSVFWIRHWPLGCQQTTWGSCNSPSVFYPSKAASLPSYHTAMRLFQPKAKKKTPMPWSACVTWSWAE